MASTIVPVFVQFNQMQLIEC